MRDDDERFFNWFMAGAMVCVLATTSTIIWAIFKLVIHFTGNC